MPDGSNVVCAAVEWLNEADRGREEGMAFQRHGGDELRVDRFSAYGTPLHYLLIWNCYRTGTRNKIFHIRFKRTHCTPVQLYFLSIWLLETEECRTLYSEMHPLLSVDPLLILPLRIMLITKFGLNIMTWEARGKRKKRAICRSKSDPQRKAIVAHGLGDAPVLYSLRRPPHFIWICTTRDPNWARM